MFSASFSNRFLHVAPVAVCAALALQACTMVTADLPECPALLSVRFVYDYNIKFADAFPHEVGSVNVWAFDTAGNPVWSGSASGDQLTREGFSLETTLTEGTYDFVAWCGLDGNDAVQLATYTPSSKEDLSLRLATAANAEGVDATAARNTGLYHGQVRSVTFEIDPTRPSFKTVTIPLVKDNNDLRIMLQHLDGSPIDDVDFTVTITDANHRLDWDNAIADGCPTVVYSPWNQKYGQTTTPSRGLPTRDVTTVASLLFELSTCRLMAGHDAILTVHRNWDDRDIIRIPLIDYLLLVKGHYTDLSGQEISDQEYLDRQDDFSIVFFIDAASNWYTAGGIVINSWVVVPPQSQGF